jgi:hypothetical protein
MVARSSISTLMFREVRCETRRFVCRIARGDSRKSRRSRRPDAPSKNFESPSLLSRCKCVSTIAVALLERSPRSSTASSPKKSPGFELGEGYFLDVLVDHPDAHPARLDDVQRIAAIVFVEDGLAGFEVDLVNILPPDARVRAARAFEKMGMCAKLCASSESPLKSAIVLVLGVGDDKSGY